jgi:3-oxoadipate enol-lactonase
LGWPRFPPRIRSDPTVVRDEGAPKIFEVAVTGGRIIGEASGDGPAVILLHAGVADRRMWRHVAPKLADAYQVIRFDFRGFGASPPSAAPYRASEDVFAVLDSLGVERAHVVGSSMGGAISMQCAVARPDRVRSLTLIASGLPGRDWSPAMRAIFDDENDALERGDVDAVVAGNLDVWVRGWDREWNDRTRAVADELRESIRIIAVNQSSTDDVELDTERPVQEQLTEITAPTLVVIAESDPPDFVAIAEHLAATVPGAESVRLPDTAHLPPLERPAELVEILTDFLGRH